MLLGELLHPGFLTNIIYVKNEGTTFLTRSLDTTDWNSTNAPDYMSLNWDYDGTTVAPNQVIQVTLTLSVSQNITGIMVSASKSQ